jgi:hypothetical protein
VKEAFWGAVIVTTGGVVSSVTLVDVLVVPRLFVAAAVSVFAPWVRGTLAV